MCLRFLNYMLKNKVETNQIEGPWDFFLQLKNIIVCNIMLLLTTKHVSSFQMNLPKIIYLFNYNF